MSLLKNYFRSLARNAVRDKFFSILNLLGLAVRDNSINPNFYLYPGSVNLRQAQ